MALQFDPGAYFNAYQTGAANELANKERPLQAINSIAQTLKDFGQTRRALQEAKRQDDLKKLMMDQEQQRWEAETYGSGGMQTAQSFPTDAPLARNMGQGPGLNMVTDFKTGEWKTANRMIPSFSGLNQAQPRKTLTERKMEWEMNKPTQTELKPQNYLGDDGRTRIGTWGPTGFVKSPNDPFAPQTTTQDTMTKETSKALVKGRVELARTKAMVNSVVGEINRVQILNDNSYGGIWGDIQMKYKSATDTDAANDPEFKNTADVINTMQSQVTKVLKSTFGGQLSDGERQYLNQVYGALPRLSKAERDIAMTNVKTMLMSKLEGDQAVVDELLSEAGIQNQQRSETQPTPDASGGVMRKTQTNTKTGAKRTLTSTDGGQTWHP